MDQDKCRLLGISSWLGCLTPAQPGNIAGPGTASCSTRLAPAAQLLAHRSLAAWLYTNAATAAISSSEREPWKGGMASLPDRTCRAGQREEW